jgi:hypothetical protein
MSKESRLILVNRATAVYFARQVFAVLVGLVKHKCTESTCKQVRSMKSFVHKIDA